MGFWGALLGGSNPTLNKGINQLGTLSGFEQNIGQKGTQSAYDYYHDLMGDPAMQAKALAPEISGQQQQLQQGTQALSQFGTRGGGTGAATAAGMAQGRGNLINLVGGLQGTAASNLANLGTTNLGAAQSTEQQQVEQSQQRMQNYINSLLGKAITTGAGAAEGYATGKFGAPSTPSIPNIFSGGGGTAQMQLPGAVTGGYGGAMPANVASAASYDPAFIQKIFGT